MARTRRSGLAWMLVAATLTAATVPSVAAAAPDVVAAELDLADADPGGVPAAHGPGTETAAAATSPTEKGDPATLRTLGAPRGRSGTPAAPSADGPQGGAPADGQVLVGFEDGVGRTEARAATAGEGDLERRIDGTDIWVVATEGDPEEVAATLEDDPRIAWASPDHARTTFRTPNDPYLHEQTSLGTVRATEAWARTIATGTVVAVVDTGVDAAHPDLTGRVLPGLDLVDDDLDADDEQGHGTLVAGIIGGRTNDGRGIAGLAWNTRILPVRVLDTAGEGHDSDVAAGIVWAAEQGADVINLSLGGPAPSRALTAAVDRARQLGAVVVAAAGNEGLEAPSYPAALSGVVAVGATDDRGRLADFSNRGDWVDLAAPGFDVLSTAPRWFHPTDPYAFFDGTSAAAPFVSAAAALVLAQDPSLTPNQVVARLRSTARDAGRRGIDPWYGHGVLDVARAVGAPTAAPLYAGGGDAAEPNDVPGRATPLLAGSSWTTIHATVAPEGDVDWYRVTTAQPGTLVVDVQPPRMSPRDARSMDPMVAVHRSDGRLLVEVDERWGDATETARIDVPPGEYLVEVRSDVSSVSNGSYEVRARVEPGAGFRFGPASTIATSASAERVALLDVTGDGRPELLVTTSSYGTPPNHLEVYAGGSSLPTGAAPLQRIALRGDDWSHTSPLAIGDLDGRGTDEVLVGTRAGVQVLRIEDGLLVDGGLVTGTRAGVTSLALGDLDGDGRTDLVVGTAHNGEPGTTDAIWLHHQTADGSFDATRLATWRATALAVADVIGDPDAEIVVASTNLFHVYRRGGTATSGYEALPFRIGLSSGWTINDLVAGDVTGDGRDDVVLSGGGNHHAQVAVHPGGDADLGARRDSPGLRDVPQSLALVDATDDGRTDVLVSHPGFGWVTLLPQRPDGHLGPQERTRTPVGGSGLPGGLAVGDLDGDGRLDAVVAGAGTGTHVLPGQPPTTVPSGGEPTWIRTASPADEARGTSLTPGITATFHRELQASSITTSTVRLLDGRTGSPVAGTVAYEAAAHRVRFTPSAPLLEGRTYQLQLLGVRDTAGERPPAPIRRFFTVLDPVPGAVTQLSVTPGLGRATLRWTNPSVPDLARVVVRTRPGTSAPSFTQGTLVYEGTGREALATGLAAGRDHAFSVFVVDQGHQVSARRTKVLRSTAIATSVSATTVTHGQTVIVGGSLFPSGGSSAKGLPNRTVELLARQHGATSFSRVATATTATDGAYRLTHRPGRHVEYRVRFPGAGDHLGVQSGVSKVSVRTAVSRSLSAVDVARGTKVTLSGTVSPNHAGQRVALQRRVDGTWQHVSNATLSSTSTYRFTLPTSTAGSRTYRVVKPKDVDHAQGASSSVTLRVR